jgi:alpha-amylase
MNRRGLCLIWVVLVVLATPLCAHAQAGFDDDRVMLQGFYWESYRHGDPEHPEFVNQKWYDIVREHADKIREARFDLIWLPPPSFAGARSAGYNPKEYYRLDNSYGSSQQQRAMLEELLRKGVEPVADIVINHRDGLNGWVDFKNPDWGLWAICADDEAFQREESGVKNTPLELRGAKEEKPQPYARHGGTTYAYDGARDIDHTNRQVRKDIIRYVLLLKSAGYRGWRYDMVHGYHARHIALYNLRSQPTFAVGEYDWGRHEEQRGWIWYTATQPNVTGADHLRTSSSVFDFTTMFSLKNNKGNYRAWYGLGRGGLGMIGDTTDDMAWKQRSVTFLENHDTGYRTNEDGSPQKDHEHDSFQNNWEVEQAYAYILTHPGVPTVFWKHYFDWGDDLRLRIQALVNARKAAGVNSGSDIDLQNNARERGIYAARITGRNGNLYVRVGGSDEDWQPSDSGYSNYRDYARGTGWKVWVELPGNPAVRQVPLKAAFETPELKRAEDVNVPDDWADE